HRDFGAGLKLIDAIGYHDLARLYPFFQRGHLIGRRAQLDRANFDDLILLHNVNELIIRPVLHRGGGDERRVVQRVDQQTGVDELVWKQRVILVFEARLDADRPRGRIDLVIDGADGAAGQQVREPAIVRLDL